MEVGQAHKRGEGGSRERCTRRWAAVFDCVFVQLCECAHIVQETHAVCACVCVLSVCVCVCVLCVGVCVRARVCLQDPPLCRGDVHRVLAGCTTQHSSAAGITTECKQQLRCGKFRQSSC